MKCFTLLLPILAFFTIPSAWANYQSPYIGGQLGYSATHHSGFNSTSLLAGRLYGGYAVSQNFSAELGYVFYPSVKNLSGDKISQHDVDIMGVANMVLIDHFSGHVKAGLAYVNAAEHSNLNVVTSKSRSWQFAFGLGMDYDFTPHLSANIDWYHVTDKEHALSNDRDLPSANLYTLGVTYRFNV